MLRSFERIGALLLGGVLAGCMSIETRGDPSYAGPRTYSGVRTSAANAGEAFLNFNIPILFVSLVDLPFSFVADTAFLPWSVPEERERQRQIEFDTDLERARPSPVGAGEGEDPLDMAKRLFAECQARLERLDPDLVDCYAPDARIDFARPDHSELQRLSGLEYRGRLVGLQRRARKRGDFMTYRDVAYFPEGERVRVRARRASARTSDAPPVEFVLGADTWGEWRILEERGSPWP